MTFLLAALSEDRREVLKAIVIAVCAVTLAGALIAIYRIKPPYRNWWKRK